MSQEVNTKQKSSDTKTSQKPLEPSAVDAYADNLMDELFSDIYRMLEDGSKLPSETAKPEYVSLETIKIPQTPKQQASKVSEEMPAQQPSNASISPPKPVAPATPVKPAKTSEPTPWLSHWVDKLLLGLAITSAIGALIVWLVSYQKLNRQFVQQPTPVAVTPTPISQSDAKFTDYMLRSLEIIDSKAQLSKQLPTVPGVPSTSKLPAISIPSNISPGLNTPSSAPSPTISPSAPSGAVASPPPVVPPRVVPTKPLTLPQASTSPSPTVTAPVPEYTLMGVVERGAGSAALVEINGVTERIRQGENIGTSGWTLVTVAKDEAIMRRNGEVRSVYVGQKF